LVASVQERASCCRGDGRVEDGAIADLACGREFVRRQCRAGDGEVRRWLPWVRVVDLVTVARGHP
jgi:hypothetical protein